MIKVLDYSVRNAKIRHLETREDYEDQWETSVRVMKFEGGKLCYVFSDGRVVWPQAQPTLPGKPEEPDYFHSDSMDYSVEDAHEVAEYHGEGMNLNSTETVEVRCYKNLPVQHMEVRVDADGRIDWSWVQRPLPLPPEEA